MTATVADNVQQTTTSTGSGNLTLDALSGRQTFLTAFGSGIATDVFYYFIVNPSAAEWEVGTGHLSDATTLVRDTVINGSNGANHVAFSAGLKYIANDWPASQQNAFAAAAAASQTSAAASATAAAASQTAAAASQTAASTSATNAAADEALAADWSQKTNGTVGGIAGQYSAKEYAQGTQASTGGSAENWAQQIGADVTGATANSRSAKSWAQEDLHGATLGGSAKDWAQSASLPDGVNKSAKSYAADAAAFAANAGAVAGQVFASVDAALSNGVKSLSLGAAGSGGTNGTFALAFSGGGGSGAAGQFTVASGAVTALWLTAPGDSYTSAPTVSFAASSGLTGASATTSIGPNATSKFFGVLQAAQMAVDIYSNTGGVATYVSTQPYAAGLNLAFERTIENSPLARTQFPLPPLVNVNPIDGKLYDTSFVPGRNVAPSGNLYSGPAVTLVTSGIPPTGYNYAIGPDGSTQNAHRIQLSANTSCHLFKTVNGYKYHIKFQLKSNAGAGAQTPVISGAGATAISEAGWTAVDINYTGNGSDFTVTTGASVPLDALIAQIQVYSQYVTTPAFASEVNNRYCLVPYGYYAAQAPGALPYVAGKNHALQGSLIGQIPLSADGVASQSFAAFTAIIAVRMDTDYTTASLLRIMNLTSASGGGSNYVGLAASQNYLNAGLPGLIYPGTVTSYANIKGQGWVFLGLRYKSNYCSVSLDEIEIASGTGGTAISAAILTCGSTINNTFPGQFGPVAAWASYLSDADFYTAIQSMRQGLSIQGADLSASFRNYLIGEGDSITVSSGVTVGAGYFQQQPMLFTPTLNAQQFAVGGSVLGNPDGSTNDSLFQRLPTVLRVIQQAAKNNRRPIFSVLTGANGFPPTADLINYWGQIRAAGAKIIAITTTGLVDPTLETARPAFNQWIRDNPQYYDALADFGNITQVGSAYAPNNYPSYFLSAGNIHPNDAGHALMGAVFTTAIQSLMI